MNQLPKPGNTVTMKKGAEVHSMHPKRHNYTLRRKQAVKVHASYPAFECDGITHRAQISWAGTGGYWCYAYVDDILVEG